MREMDTAQAIEAILDVTRDVAELKTEHVVKIAGVVAKVRAGGIAKGRDEMREQLATLLRELR